MVGTLRTFDMEMRDFIMRRVNETPKPSPRAAAARRPWSGSAKAISRLINNVAFTQRMVPTLQGTPRHARFHPVQQFARPPDSRTPHRQPQAGGHKPQLAPPPHVEVSRTAAQSGSPAPAAHCHGEDALQTALSLAARAIAVSRWAAAERLRALGNPGPALAVEVTGPLNPAGQGPRPNPGHARGPAAARPRGTVPAAAGRRCPGGRARRRGSAADSARSPAVARELGIPAVVGCGDATEVLKEGALVTVACSEGDTGYVYDGLLETEVTEVERGELPYCAGQDHDERRQSAARVRLRADAELGVGLARLEFIINNNIGVHPKAILDYPNIDGDLKKAVESVARGHASPRAFYVDKLAEGIATIAAAFWPKPVIVRLSDFKSNEYRKLIGGSRYEPEEENPMLGFRGASRYVSETFGEAFAMECEALKPRAPRHGPDQRRGHGAVRAHPRPGRAGRRHAGRARPEARAAGGSDGLRVIMMCEVPSNAILAEQFLEHFDGFSIGSNDLTQLTLGLDRDSGLELLAKDFDERDPAVKALISRAIAACRATGKYIGICGQGPSDHPDFADWLADEGIVSISLNPDSVVDDLAAAARAAEEAGRPGAARSERQHHVQLVVVAACRRRSRARRLP